MRLLNSFIQLPHWSVGIFSTLQNEKMYIHLTIRCNSFYDMVVQYKRTTSPPNLQLDIN